MSTLGKILAFLNVLFAIILLVFAAKDYGEARAARYAVFRHEMVVTGLPVDKDERRLDQPDEPIVEKLPPKVLADIFAGAEGGPDLGGAPVATVMEELDRVKAKTAD